MFSIEEVKKIFDVLSNVFRLLLNLFPKNWFTDFLNFVMNLLDEILYKDLTVLDLLRKLLDLLPTQYAYSIKSMVNQ
ncbi:MAG: hypothetical protein SNJ64_01885 [Endomicrobiia bacterium]